MNKQEYVVHEVAKQAARVSLAAQDLQAMSDGSRTDAQNAELVSAFKTSIEQFDAILEEAYATLEYTKDNDTFLKEDIKRNIRSNVAVIDKRDRILPEVTHQQPFSIFDIFR